jgi:hypothetical protein
MPLSDSQRQQLSEQEGQQLHRVLARIADGQGWTSPSDDNKRKSIARFRREIEQSRPARIEQARAGLCSCRFSGSIGCRARGFCLVDVCIYQSVDNRQGVFVGPMLNPDEVSLVEQKAFSHALRNIAHHCLPLLRMLESKYYVLNGAYGN